MTSSAVHRSLAPPRLTALTGIVALHALIAYLLLTALVQQPNAEPPPPTKVSFTPDVPRKPPPLPPLPTRPPDPTVVIPNLPIPLVRPPDPVAREAPVSGPVIETPGAAGTAQAAELPIRVLGRHWLPSSEAYYPADLIRNDVQGDAQVRVCIDGAGRLAGAPVLERSSGNARLDQGALNIARAGRYARAVRGNTPVANCYQFHIVFTMRPPG